MLYKGKILVLLVYDATIYVNKRVSTRVNKQRKFLLRIAFLYKNSQISAICVICSVSPMDLYLISMVTINERTQADC